MTDDLVELERIAGALLRSLSSSQRRTLMRRMARQMAQSQRTRIAAQRQPDGSAYEPRKAKPAAISGRGAACFLYPSGGGGEPRRVILKSFTWATDRMMTGFDIETGAIRSFDFDKIVQWLPVPDDYRNAGGGTLRRRGGLRRRAMFRRLASARYLRSQASDGGFWVGFSAKAAQIANIHHFGLRDRPSLRAKAAVDYPKRGLLGMTLLDRDTMFTVLYSHFADF